MQPKLRPTAGYGYRGTANLAKDISIRLQNNNAPWPYGWGRHEQGETDADSEHGWQRRFKTSVDAPTWMFLLVNGLSRFRCAPPSNERT